ncbi:hypothetical protein QBC43DRAFT_294320 [Cladorrhinum sp. PSN259]|nr:hypothetical protein QBC43DRAFT_294320 [Cladorrhinum sp. PSN259]
MTSFGPPPGFTPPASSSGDDGGSNRGNSVTSDHPWAWVLIPVAVLISLGAVAACLHTSRRRRRTAQLAHESSLSHHIRNGHPSSPHLSPRSRGNRRGNPNRSNSMGRDLEAAYALSDTTRSTRWWSSLPPGRPTEEGLNELGEAPPPYEKAHNAPPKNGNNNGDAAAAVEEEQEQEQEMSELPAPNNEIAELDAGESSRPRLPIRQLQLADDTLPKEMDATASCSTPIEKQTLAAKLSKNDDDEDTTTTTTDSSLDEEKEEEDEEEEPEETDSDSEGVEVEVVPVQYHQAYAVTITSAGPGTASSSSSSRRESRTESPASWTRGDDSSPRLGLNMRTRTRRSSEVNASDATN